MTPFDNATPPDANAYHPETPPHAAQVEQATQGVAQVVITMLLVTLSFAAGWFGNSYVNRTAYASNSNEKLILEAWSDIDNYYVVTGSIDHQKMAYAAINAMVQTLGDTGHSRFDTPEQIAAENNSLNNTPSVGIGVLISGGGTQPFKIVEIFPGSPAAGSTLRAGDIIVAVNGTNVQGKTFDDLHLLITGKSGTTVTLTVIHPGETAPVDVSMKRADFTPPTVEGQMLPGTHIADIHLLEFTNTADADLQKQIKDLKGQGATSIIFDLRGNGGGLLDEAISVSSEFVAAGSGKNVLIQKTRDSQSSVPVKAGGIATDIPLVVLVDNNTASAAEITTGAIKVNRPEVHVVGATTAGTGTVLQTILLSDGSALVLGTGEWLLPNGQSIYHKGFVPDQPVALPDTQTAIDPLQIQQSNYTLDQLEANDAQLAQAIADLS
jgi:carboxyl-terminal processing protease